MKQVTATAVLICSVLFFAACNSGQITQQTEAKEPKSEKTAEYFFTCNLKDDPEVIAKYRRYHSQDGVWPDVTAAGKRSGAERIRIFIQDTRLVLIITLPADLPFDKFNDRYNNYSGKLSEWDKLMSSYQVPPPGAEEGQTWVPMECIYDLTNLTEN